MKIYSDKIDLFQNISQFDFDKISYDFHNDFECVKIKFQNNVLILILQNIVSHYIVSLSFNKTILTFCEFDFTEKVEPLTIDNLYRGRFENDGKLTEFENNRGYYYLEFYEGQKIEFWSESLSVE
ncbi:hypothetical protein [Flavobacterium sp.]|uniref:hypothetical protein n=1 Tax=Flavobacterium sp. TaxID=239 RepID=UPI002633C8D0|nr:hypothetical protein [Flavobacterium sp.]